MTTLFPRKDDTLTSRNITDSYIYAYEVIHGTKPECQHVDGRWFMVNGTRRDRHWIVIEIERLRQEALSNTFNHEKTPQTSNIFRVIRRLSRL